MAEERASLVKGDRAGKCKGVREIGIEAKGNVQQP